MPAGNHLPAVSSIGRFRRSEKATPIPPAMVAAAERRSLFPQEQRSGRPIAMIVLANASEGIAMFYNVPTLVTTTVSLVARQSVT